VIPFGRNGDRPDYAWADDVDLRLFAPSPGQRTRVVVPGASGGPDVAGGSGAEFEVTYADGRATARIVAGSSSGFGCTVIGGLT
jgi:alpha-D-xyloside xylohydrolase